LDLMSRLTGRMDMGISGVEDYSSAALLPFCCVDV
jgi:hypothetical protein